MKICKSDEIINPFTNRCIKKHGKIAKKLLSTLLKKSVKKSAKKSVKKSRKSAKKSAKKSVKKSVKKSAKKSAKSHARVSVSEYNRMIKNIIDISKEIQVLKGTCDGRTDSALKEGPFLEELKTTLEKIYPTWDIVISPPRASCDIMINGLRINLKLTDCKTADNSMNKPSIYYSITGLTTYPYSSNWNEFINHLEKTKDNIKYVRDRQTEYHYLVKNKRTGDVLLKPIFDIHTYISNPSNDLQINWKHEFLNRDYYTEEDMYIQKVLSLLKCIQLSVKEMIKRNETFAYANIDELFKKE
jgi:hypothetical protein